MDQSLSDDKEQEAGRVISIGGDQLVEFVAPSAAGQLQRPDLVHHDKLRVTSNRARQSASPVPESLGEEMEPADPLQSAASGSGQTDTPPRGDVLDVN